MSTKETLNYDKLQVEVDKMVNELHEADPKLKKVFPIVVEGEEYDEKPYYIAYFKQPSFVSFSKFMTFSQKDQVVALKELAKECFLDGDKDLINDESLFMFGLMPHLSQLIEVRKGKIVNLSKAGK